MHTQNVADTCTLTLTYMHLEIINTICMREKQAWDISVTQILNTSGKNTDIKKTFEKWHFSWYTNKGNVFTHLLPFKGHQFDYRSFFERNITYAYFHN